MPALLPSYADIAPSTPYVATTADQTPVAVTDPTKSNDGVGLAMKLKWFRAHQDTKTAEMREQRDSRRYYHGAQLTDHERKILSERGQPDIVFNQIQRKVDSVCGLVERLRQDPKAYARTPQHDQGADLATAVLRFVFDSSRWPDISAQVAHDLAVDGIGGVEFSLEPTDDGSHDVEIALVPPETWFYDPRSIKPDFSDARFKGVYKWMDFEAAVELMPDKEEELRQAMVSYGNDGDSQGLRDWEKLWYDTTLDRVKIVEMWYKHRGEWRVCIHTGHLELIDAVSPFRDDKGKTHCRFVMTSCQVDQDGDRYGIVRNLKGPQDEINHGRSAWMHYMFSNQVIADEGSVNDVEKAKRELAKKDAWITKNPGSELVINNHQLQMQGQAERLAEAKQEIQNYGPNPELIGQGGKDQSGRAIALLQQAGMAALGPYLIAYKAWKLNCYRMAWMGVRVGWTTARFIRITDNPQQVQQVMVNQPVSGPYGPQVGPDGQPLLVNAIGQIDVDILLDEGPDTITLREDIQEQVKDMVMAKMLPPAAYFAVANLPPDVKQLIEQATAPKPPGPEDQLKLAGAQAEVQELQSRAALNMAKAHQAGQPQSSDEPPAFELPPDVQIAQAAAEISDKHASAVNKLAQAHRAETMARMEPFKIAQAQKQAQNSSDRPR
jgi:hypothetical protein